MVSSGEILRDGLKQIADYTALGLRCVGTPFERSYHKTRMEHSFEAALLYELYEDPGDEQEIIMALRKFAGFRRDQIGTTLCGVQAACGYAALVARRALFEAGVTEGVLRGGDDLMRFEQRFPHTSVFVPFGQKFISQLHEQ